MLQSMPSPRRRCSPRVPVESLCSEYYDDTERHALVVDLSEDGLRIQRPFRPGPHPREIQIEFEIPGVDELIWARAELCFDQLWQRPATVWGHLPTQRTSGVRVLAAANRHSRMLREYVVETSRSLYVPPASDWLMMASCYYRG